MNKQAIHLNNHGNPRWLWWLLLVLGMIVFSQRLRAQCLQLDVVLVLDYSSSVHGKEKLVSSAGRVFAQRFELSEDRVRVGIVLFESTATVFPLTGSRAELEATLAQVSRKVAGGGGTNIALGLRSATDLLLVDRSTVRKLIVLVSDGLHNEGEEEPESVALLAQQFGITLATVTVSEQAKNEALMRRLATPEFAFEATYESLVQTLKELDVCL